MVRGNVKSLHRYIGRVPMADIDFRVDLRFSVLDLRSSLRLEHLDERLLRDVDLANTLHSLLSFLLFLQQFSLAGDIAAVAFRGHVFSQGRNAFASTNFS